jgi:hypothetical protein
MTYLEMVNNVLRRLRERTASTVALNDYTQLIGILVNDAKREVENSWDWSGLRSNIDVTTVQGTSVYELNDTLNRITVLDVWNDDDDQELTVKPEKWIRNKIKTAGDQQDKPLYYSFSTTSSDGDTQLTVYPEPDGVYNLDVQAVIREDDLSENSDVTLMPTQPILMLAYAKAIEERGEDAGVNSSVAYAMAYKSLSDHIALDANRRPDELIWSEV